MRVIEGSMDGGRTWVDITRGSGSEWRRYKNIRSRDVETREERLANAAPELLVMLKEMCKPGNVYALKEAEALIARVEGGK